MTTSKSDIDEEAYPIPVFMGGLHVEVRLLHALESQQSRRWFNALHAFAAGHHMRTEEVDGLILVRGAGKGVRSPSGAISHPGVMPMIG